MSGANNIMLLSETAEKTFTVEGPLVAGSFEIFGITINITETVIIQFGIVAALSVLFFILGRKLAVRPEGKRQVIAEYIVSFFTNNVKENMGDSYHRYTPYIGAIFCLSLISSLTGLLGLKAPTGDLSIVASWGIITFIMIQRNKLKTGGLKGFGKSLMDPVFIMLPFNIISEFATPVSMTLRHFGNILAGGVIGGLIYYALGNFAIGIPAVASLYFDLFSAVIQAYIFVMLTMVNISMAECD